MCIRVRDDLFKRSGTFFYNFKRKQVITEPYNMHHVLYYEMHLTRAVLLLFENHRSMNLLFNAYVPSCLLSSVAVFTLFFLRCRH